MGIGSCRGVISRNKREVLLLRAVFLAGHHLRSKRDDDDSVPRMRSTGKTYAGCWRMWIPSRAGAGPGPDLPLPKHWLYVQLYAKYGACTYSGCQSVSQSIARELLIAHGMVYVCVHQGRVRIIFFDGRVKRTCRFVG
jgi:hypothetical protein